MNTSWSNLPAADRGGVHPAWRDSFARAGLVGFDDFMTREGEVLHKPGLGGRHRARLELQHAGQDTVVYLKRYHRESPAARLRRWLKTGQRQSAAAYEAEIALALAADGIRTMTPLAWGERGADSFVMMSEVPGDAVDRRLDNTPPSPAEREQLVTATADLARRFHQHGWRHRDFYLCHFFADRVGDGFQVALIDLQRVFRPRWRADRWRVKDLAQLHYSATACGLSATVQRQWFKRYLGVPRLGPPERRLLGRVVAKSQSMIRRHGLVR